MSLSNKSFDTPDEQRTLDKTTLDVVQLDGATVARTRLEPGWTWSDCVKPVVGTDSCQVRHVGALVAGQLEVTHDDGSSTVIKAGEAYVVEPGHDARVVGDEAAVGYEFESAATYGTA